MGSDPSSHISPDRRDRDAEPSDAVSAPNHDDPQEHDPQEPAVPDDNSLFQEELGCMTLDSMGKYRKFTVNLQTNGPQYLLNYRIYWRKFFTPMVSRCAHGQ
jgi:hypothetical protein